MKEGAAHVQSPVERFYDRFTGTFLRDYVYGNPRVERQCRFFAEAVASTAQRVLIVGCGLGQAAYGLAGRISRHGRILAVDISGESIAMAKALHRHDRIEYRKVDVIAEPIAGRWDVIALPDVYEHIPREARESLHDKLDTLLSANGKILLTVPSPGTQAALYEAGTGLQVVDEIVELDDLLQLARAVRGTLTYFGMVSVWNSNDYIHAVVERGGDRIGPLDGASRVPIKGWPRRNVLSRGWRFGCRTLGCDKLRRWWRSTRVRKMQRLAAAQDRMSSQSPERACEG